MQHQTQPEIASAAAHGISRSPHWPAVEHAHLAKQPRCLCCGKDAAARVKLNVHHKYPFHYIVAVGRPDLELDERNLFTLCVDHEEEHHLLVGHLGNFESYNPDFEHFLALCRGLLASQIRSLPAWLHAVAKRPEPLALMNSQDRLTLRKRLDTLMPPLALMNSQDRLTVRKRLDTLMPPLAPKN